MHCSLYQLQIFIMIFDQDNDETFQRVTKIFSWPYLNLRDLEGSYFCFTDQSMAAPVWLRAAMLSSVPGVEIHLHTSHSILLLPVLNLKRRIEWALQSMNGRGTRIFNSNCVSYKTVTLRLKSFIVIVETFFAADTKENCKSLKPVSVHDRNEA